MIIHKKGILGKDELSVIELAHATRKEIVDEVERWTKKKFKWWKWYTTKGLIRKATRVLWKTSQIQVEINGKQIT